MHPHHQHTDRHARAEHLMKGGSARHSDEKEDRVLFNKLFAEKKRKHELKEGGAVHGKKAHRRMDKRARGGRVKKPSAVVNVMIGKPSSPADQMTMPMAAHPMPLAPPMGAAPPGIAGGPMPPGIPGASMMRKHGGRVKHRASGGSANDAQANEQQERNSQAQYQRFIQASRLAELGRERGGPVKHLGEAKNRTEKMRREMANKKHFRKGGRVNSYPAMTAGAATGEGRLEKVEKYGKRA